MLYGVSVFLYLTLMVIKDPNQLKDKRRLLGGICVLMVPAVLFIIYMALVPATQIGDSWVEGVVSMFRFYLLSCAGAFRARSNQLWQIVMTKPGRDCPDCRIS